LLGVIWHNIPRPSGTPFEEGGRKLAFQCVPIFRKCWNGCISYSWLRIKPKLNNLFSEPTRGYKIHNGMVFVRANLLIPTVMKLAYTFILLATLQLPAQNLVPNGNFEQLNSCPNSVSQLSAAVSWMAPSLGTSDCFNLCACCAATDVPHNIFGYRPAFSGVGYAGIALFWTGANDHREYLETPLTASLVAGQCYHFEMYMSASDSCKYITANIGAYFSSSMLYSLTPSSFNLVPHIANAPGNTPDTLNWTLVSGNYVAAGGETYLTIGNFLDTQSTVITSTDNALPYPGAYVYIDNVSLTPCTYVGLENQEASFADIHPNPVKEVLNVRLNHYEAAEIVVYDLAGQVVIRQEFIQSTALDTDVLEKGMYFYSITNKGGVLKQGKLVKD
jgi:hypothetical protein